MFSSAAREEIKSWSITFLVSLVFILIIIFSITLRERITYLIIVKGLLMMSKSKGSSNQKQLFKTKIVPGKPGSGKLFEEEFVVDEGPVECLGMTFENDEKRREFFQEKLRDKLKDPEFRKIEGFPIGEDDDILAFMLSPAQQYAVTAPGISVKA